MTTENRITQNDFKHISEILCDVMDRILPQHQQQGGKNENLGGLR